MISWVYLVLGCAVAAGAGMYLGGSMRAEEIQDLRLREETMRLAYTELLRRIRQGRVRIGHTDTACFHAQGTARDRLANVRDGIADCHGAIGGQR